ncbi:MAG: M24 family metallopeptidase [Myxococcales bacterium]|nr:M24 family metallopeptidase [Myxococcales bacterium]
MRALSVVALLAAAPVLAHPPAGIPQRPPPDAPRGPALLGDGHTRLDEVQAQIIADRVDGWLLTDWRAQDEAALDLVHPQGAPSRRWFQLIPAAGPPITLAFQAEAAAFDLVPGGKLTYASWGDLDGALRALLRGRKRVAMNYSPRGAVPSLSRVDAGVMERVRAAGVQAVPAGDLLTLTRARWSEPQRAAHYFAIRQIEALKIDAFRRIAEAAKARTRLTEHDLQQRLSDGLAARGLETESPPAVAAGVHTADPTYRATAASSAEIRAGDVVRVTIVARQAAVPGAVYAEGIWTGVVGDRVPERLQAAWVAVRSARDQAVALLRERREKRLAVRGFEVDAVMGPALAKAGGQRLHAGGHSLGEHLHGDGPDLDDRETHDDRVLLLRTAYSIAPGVYFPGEFGVRTAVDVHLGAPGIEVTVEKPQQELETIGASPPVASAPAARPAAAKESKPGAPPEAKRPEAPAKRVEPPVAPSSIGKLPQDPY